MLRGCLGALALLALFIGGYYYWLDTVFERPESIYAACGVGFVAFLAFGALLNARKSFNDWRLVSTARHGMPAKNGRLVAVSGTIHPLGSPLLAPFSGAECTIVEYDLTSRKRIDGVKDPQTAGSDYAGFLMTPCAIRSPMGEVRLMGFPILEGFNDRECTGYGSARNARDFLTTAQFEDRTGVKMLTLLNVFGAVWSDDDGHVEKNLRIGKTKLTEIFPDKLDAELDRFTEWEQQNPGEAKSYRDLHGSEAFAETGYRSKPSADGFDLEEEPDEEDDDEPEVDEAHGFTAAVPKMTEKRVEVGETVCAIGIYDEIRMGLCPPRGSTKPNRLLKGSADAIEARCRSSLVSNLIGGLVVLLLLNGGVFGAMQIYLHSDEAIEKRTEKAFAAVEKNDLATLQQLQRRKFDVARATNSEGQTLLMRAADPALAAWLIEQGTNVNAVDKTGTTALIYAARQNRPAVARQLIDTKAKVDFESTSTRRTALMEADEYRSFEIADMLRKAGARDDVVTMHNGEPLPSGGGPQLQACKDYLAAMQAQDVARLQQLVSRDNGSTWDGDWNLWKSVHIATVTGYEGFVRGDDATLRLYGDTGGGFQAYWSYQLRREDGEWKIAREKWLTQ